MVTCKKTMVQPLVYFFLCSCYSIIIWDFYLDVSWLNFSSLCVLFDHEHKIWQFFILNVPFSVCLSASHRNELPESAYIHQLLGLNLLFLLSQNRVSEFHTELERLSAKDIQTNVYIRHPVSLEQVNEVSTLRWLAVHILRGAQCLSTRVYMYKILITAT